MRKGNVVSGGVYDDSPFTTIRKEAMQRVRVTGENLDDVIGKLLSKNPGIKPDDEVTQFSINWEGFYDEETGVGDAYIGNKNKTQFSKGELTEEEKNFNKANMNYQLEPTFKNLWNLGKAWFNKIF